MNEAREVTANERLQQRLRLAREEAGFTQKDLALKADMVRETVANFELGRKPISIENLRALAKATGKHMTWFFQDEEPPPQSEEEQARIRRVVREEMLEVKKELRRLGEARSDAADSHLVQVPLLGEVPGGPPRDAVEAWEETIPVPRAWAGPRDDAFALRVEGDSMMPTICPGDIVVVRPGLEPQNRQVVVVRFDDTVAESVATIKRYVRTRRGTFLEADNDKHPRIEKPAGATIVGVVRGLLRAL